MSRSEAEAALRTFPPLLVQLVASDATERSILAEGFTVWERQAVRTLLRRADTASPVSTGSSSHPGTLVTSSGSS